MIGYVAAGGASLFAAALTLFSGFGLGSIMLPVFAVFFPIEIAVAATAVVHLLNNLFKIALLGRHTNWKVVAAFGVPAVFSAFAGALVLNHIAKLPPVANYELVGTVCEIRVVSILVAAMMVVFAVFELWPRLQKLSIDRKHLPLGGTAAGFVGGISGHQGALRAAFLIKSGLKKEEYLGTGVACAVVVDVARLTVYGLTFLWRDFTALSEGGGLWLLAVATGAAFIGSYAGSRLIEKITITFIKYLVGAMLLLLAAAIGSGLV